LALALLSLQVAHGQQGPEEEQVRLKADPTQGSQADPTQRSQADPTQRQQADPTTATMTFFVTSAGRGFGGNLGGLAGADAQCQRLATAAGHGHHTWRAYLSAPAANGQPAVHARDRIGGGPWVNAMGVHIADSVADLHGPANGITADTALTEMGRGIGPTRHDMLTGSNPDGTLSAEAPDTTCRGWTSLNTGRAMLGHTNRYGGGQRSTSWNSAHLSRGCSQDALRASNGAAQFYCFAAD
jgi:hypothetical protein